MAIPNLTEGGTQTVTFEELKCFPEFAPGIRRQHYIDITSAVNIFLSVSTFLGNSLILVALRKESSIHPPSKLLYRCLATTDLFVGLVTQPITVTYWMSLVHKDWSLCRYAQVTSFITGHMFSSVSFLTLSAISVDRLLALSLGLRYKQVVTLKRTFVGCSYLLGCMPCRCSIVRCRSTYNIWLCLCMYTITHRNRLVHKDFLGA